jgi:hypothetical protein
MSAVIDPIFSFNIWLIVKWFYMIAFILYTLFALVIVRQVSLMTQTVNEGMNLPVKTFSYLHLLISIIITVIGFLIL